MRYPPLLPPRAEAQPPAPDTILLNVEIVPGSLIPQAIRDALLLANKLNVRVRTKANGRSIYLKPGDDAASVIEAYCG